MLKVTILGRPNVGKSSLFNLLGKRARALTGDTAGLTRDTQSTLVEYDGRAFEFIDTAGLQKDKEMLAQKMTNLSMKTTDKADVIVFMVSARDGLLPWDIVFAKEIRQKNKPVILIANKAETMDDDEPILNEFLKLGFGKPLRISATHNKGISTLIKNLIKFAPKDIVEEAPKNDKLRLTVIGRPNAGKSTFINTLIGEEKLLTGEMAGVTRDSIEVPFTYKEQSCTLIDTAGMRKKSRVAKTSIEGQSVSQAIDAVNQSNVVVMMVDALLGVEAQDLHIANYAFEQGKPILFAVNKVDVVENKKTALADVKKRLGFSFAQIKDPIILPVSALKGKGLSQVMKKALALFEKTGTRLSTGKLNTWLDKALSKNPPPLSRLKRPMAIKYITQVETFPPHFVVFVGGASSLPESYKNYLMNSLKEAFKLEETPIRLSVRTQKNPYQKS